MKQGKVRKMQKIAWTNTLSRIDAEKCKMLHETVKLMINEK
jgi:hypothetical protein